jgi:hypothetical protein
MKKYKSVLGPRMLQLIEKILSDCCDTGNEAAAIECIRRLPLKAAPAPDVGSTTERLACHVIHALQALSTSATGAGVVEAPLALMLKDLMFYCDSYADLKKYLRIPAAAFAERAERYDKICRRYFRANGFNWNPPSYATAEGTANASQDQGQGQGHSQDQGPKTTHSIVLHGTGTKAPPGKQLVTIKTVIEQEVSMYIDVNIQCPKFLKIAMPHLDEPIYISRVIKKYAKFASIFDGRGKENTLSYYYKFNKADATLEFIDEDMETEVAELLGVGLNEKEYVDEEQQLLEDAKKNHLSAEQITEFKAQLDEVRSQLRISV